MYAGFRDLEPDFSGRVYLCLWGCQRHGQGCPPNSPHHCARAGISFFFFFCQMIHVTVPNWLGQRLGLIGRRFFTHKSYNKLEWGPTTHTHKHNHHNFNTRKRPIILAFDNDLPPNSQESSSLLRDRERFCDGDGYCPMAKRHSLSICYMQQRPIF